MIFSVVVLPHPLGPMMLVSSPVGTSNVMPPSARTPPSNSLVRSTTRTCGLHRDAHIALISGRNSRRSMCWSSVTLTLATMMIERIAANIAG